MWNLLEGGFAMAVTVKFTSDEVDEVDEVDGDDVCGLGDGPGVVVGPGVVAEGP